MLSHISNFPINGTELILNRVFDKIGFNQIKNEVFRKLKLVLSRLSFPASKAATVGYLKNHYDEGINLSKIYRYPDHLNNKQYIYKQHISIECARKILGGCIG